MAKVGEVVGGAGVSVDPICGRQVASGGRANLSAEYKKRTYFFCSENCRHAFSLQTERFRLGELAKSGALLSPGKVRWGMA